MSHRGRWSWAVLGLALAAAPGFGAEPPTSAAVRRMFDAWKAPVPPRHLVGNIHYVGTNGVSAYLITTPAGHILLDTGFEDTLPQVCHSIEQLGFKLTDIKLLLSSHAHIDHTGGHARMKELTGAQVCASAADAEVLESGGLRDFIPFPRETILYPPVKVDRRIADGEAVTLGDTTLVAHLTPGHTRGATTWTMDATEGGRVYHVVFFSSASVNAGTKLVGNPAYPQLVADLTATFARLRELPCDIFFAPHGGQFAMADKFARLDRGEGPAALVDPAGWHETIDGAEKVFRGLLAEERAAATGGER